MFLKLAATFNTLVRITIISAISLLSAMAIAAVEDDIKKRTEPMGTMCMVGDSCAAAPVVVASGPRSGADIYSAKCIACHGSGAAGAPKLGDSAAWSPRIATGIETLYGHAINGFNGMPAKGLCMDCSEDEIKATVDYMVEESK